MLDFLFVGLSVVGKALLAALGLVFLAMAIMAFYDSEYFAGCVLLYFFYLFFVTVVFP